MGIPLLLIVLVITIYVCNRTIQKNSETYIYSTVSDIPYNKVGLLLGTSPKLKSGKANLYFDYRIKAATELYKAGIRTHILSAVSDSLEVTLLSQINCPFVMKLL